MEERSRERKEKRGKKKEKKRKSVNKEKKRVCVGLYDFKEMDNVRKI